MAHQVTIDERFMGPPGNANGGYACGVVGTRIGAVAEVNLRKPIPLGVQFDLDLEQAQLTDGGDVLADGASSELTLEVPEPVAFADARASEDNYVCKHAHPFPGCFVCGIDRAAGDGLRVFPGKVEARDVVASGWIPDRSLPGQDGVADDLITWSVLDCPTAFGSWLANGSGVSVLAKLEARLIAPVAIGEQHVVIGWPIDGEGRKSWGGSAIFNADAELRAYARGLWIQLKS